MTRKIAAVVVAVALVAAVFVAGSYTVNAASQAKFEYQILGMRLQPRSETVGDKKVLTDAGMLTEFNFQGEQGWEYVGNIPGKEDAYFVVFRRQK